MKKAIVLSSVLCLAASTSVYAGSTATEAKQAGVFFGSTIAGAVIGGPVGMMLGAASGVWLDHQIDKADQLLDSDEHLAVARDRIDDLTVQLAQVQSSSAEYAQLALEQLQLEMLFKTGESDLAPTGIQRLSFLAKFMNEHPELSIRLDGYSDPRGDAGYNLALSGARVAAVAEQLLAFGLDETRVSTFSHGATLSQSQEGDYDSYALDRMVSISLSSDRQSAAVARVDISH